MDSYKKSQGVVITMQDHYFATGIKVLLSCGQLESISGGLTMTLCSFTPNCLIFPEERHSFPKQVQSPPELVWRGSGKEHERNLTSDFKAVIWETIIIKEKKKKATRCRSKFPKSQGILVSLYLKQAPFPGYSYCHEINWQQLWKWSLNFPKFGYERSSNPGLSSDIRKA